MTRRRPGVGSAIYLRVMPGSGSVRVVVDPAPPRADTVLIPIPRMTPERETALVRDLRKLAIHLPAETLGGGALTGLGRHRMRRIESVVRVRTRPERIRDRALDLARDLWTLPARAFRARRAAAEVARRETVRRENDENRVETMRIEAMAAWRAQEREAAEARAALRAYVANPDRDAWGLPIDPEGYSQLAATPGGPLIGWGETAPALRVETATVHAHTRATPGGGTARVRQHTRKIGGAANA